MDGLLTVIALALAPSAASFRRLGTMSDSSFHSHAGNPSMLIRITCWSLRGTAAQNVEKHSAAVSARKEMRKLMRESGE
jgi:hypothetical protein